MFRVVTLSAGLCLALTACVSNPQEKMMDGMNALALQVAQEMQGGMGALQVGAHVNNPGYRVEVGFAVFAETRLVGTDGSMTASKTGAISEISEETRAMIFRIARDVALTREARRQMILDLIRPLTQIPKDVIDLIRDLSTGPVPPPSPGEPMTRPAGSPPIIAPPRALPMDEPTHEGGDP